MKRAWQNEFDRYEAMTTGEQIVWLSRLLFFVSMLARETYGAEPDAVNGPAKLRRFNELLHRISSHLLQSVSDSQSGMPNNTFFELLAEETEGLGIGAESLLKRLK